MKRTSLCNHPKFSRRHSGVRSDEQNFRLQGDILASCSYTVNRNSMLSHPGELMVGINQTFLGDSSCKLLNNPHRRLVHACSTKRHNPWFSVRCALATGRCFVSNGRRDLAANECDGPPDRRIFRLATNPTIGKG
jgi:hypothetical protein